MLFDYLGADASRTMIVLRAHATRVLNLPQFKILDPIVASISVLMVNALMRFQIPSKRILHNNTMFLNVPRLFPRVGVFGQISNVIPLTSVENTFAGFSVRSLLVQILLASMTPNKPNGLPFDPSISGTTSCGDSSFLATPTFAIPGDWFNIFNTELFPLSHSTTIFGQAAKLRTCA